MIDADLLARIAQLARLGVSPEGAAALADDVAAILKHFEQLAEVDVSAAPPWTSALEQDGLAAPDEPAPWPRPRETLLPLTEHAREGFFVVPAILDRPAPGDERPAPAPDSGPPADPDPADDEDVF